MPPIDFTQLTQTGILAVAIVFLAWVLAPAIRSLAETNSKTLARLDASKQPVIAKLAHV